MTDAEMVKAMEICKDKEIPCDDCPLVECGDCGEISRQYFYDRFKQLQSENAALKDRLDKAIELPSVREITVNTNGKPIIIYEAVYLNKYGCVMKNLYYNDKESAEARLKELKGGKNE